MKNKILIGLCLLVLISFIPNKTHATSGACSYHSGVNCSAGASITGNAICNDGFISSVNYYSMNECQINTTDFCSPVYAIQQMTAYTSAPSDAIRSVIKSNISSLAQNENDTLNNYQQKLNSLIQEDTNIFNGEIQQYQQEQQSAISAAQATVASLNSSGGISSSNDSYVSSAGNQYITLIQNAQQDENISIQTAHAQFDSHINSATQCVNSLNKLAYSLSTYQAPIMITPVSTSSPDSNTTNKSCHIFSNHLQMGSTGSEVIALQSWLVTKNFLVVPAGIPLGSFGGLTKTAVSTYQKSIGLPSTGYVGDMTINKLNTSCN